MTNKIEHTTLSFTKTDRYFKCQTTAKINNTKKKLATYAKTRKEANAKMIAKLESLSKVEKKEVEEKKEHEILENAIKAYNDQTDILKNNKESTICYLNQYLRCHISTYDIAKMKVDEVTRSDVMKWINSMKADKKSDAVQKKAYNVMSAFFKYYYRDQPNQNPCSDFHFTQKEKAVEATQILNDYEIEWLVDACENAYDEKNADIIEVLLFSYMRSGELIGLKVKDWLDAEQTLCIRSTLTRDREGHYCVKQQTKTRTSKRDIIVNDVIYDIIQMRLIELEAEHDRLKPNWYIFHSEKYLDKPISRTAIKHLLERMLKRAGIRKQIRVHDLRHSGISYFLRHGGTLADVSRRAGHSKQSITADIYSHAIDESLKKENDFESQLAAQLVEKQKLHVVKSA